MLNTFRKRSLGGGAVAGVVIAVLVVLAVLAAAAFFIVRRRRSGKSGSQTPTISNPISDYEKISAVAPQLPNPPVTHMTDKEIERMYLRTSASSHHPKAPRFSQEIEPPLPRGKLAVLTGDTPPRSLDDMAPRARIQSLKPAAERRSVPYRPDDFA